MATLRTPPAVLGLAVGPSFPAVGDHKAGDAVEEQVKYGAEL
jgi:hypothetical protein